MFVETKNPKWYETLWGREEGVVLMLQFTKDNRNAETRLKADFLACPKLMTAQKNCSSK